MPAEHCWDVDAVDAAGNMLVSWRGLRLRDAGPLPRTGAWPAPLLSVYLERSAAELGLADGIQVSVQCTEAAAPGAGQAPADAAADQALAVPAAGPKLAGPQITGPELAGPKLAGPQITGPELAGPELAGPQITGPQITGPQITGPQITGPQIAAPEPAASGGGGWLAGFALTATGGHTVCSWHAADPAQGGPAADPRLAGLRTELARRFSEPRATLNARLRAIAACLPAPDPRELHLAIDRVSSERWVLLRTGGAVIACTVADISGVPLPVAIALASSDSGGGPGSSDGRECPGSGHLVSPVVKI